ncbi:MAG: hypothetical protein JXO44_13715 [Clostridia bacterium]|nr:hypothetical protein [Clostridia bacterium]
MRKYINAEVMQHSMKLQQMGAKVNVVNSKLCYVSFDVCGFAVAYAYNVNAKGKYFLERIKPYPLPLKVFEREEDLIDIIRIDLEQFKNAIRSHNINDFIDISRHLSMQLKRFEDLFLYYNIPEDEIKALISHLEKIDDDIERIKGTAERLYFVKEPENL